MEVFPEAARRGFTEATARYGLLLDHIEWAFVDGWAYLCPRPIGPLEDERGRQSAEDFSQLVDSAPELGERLAVSARVFEDRRWREEWPCGTTGSSPGCAAGTWSCRPSSPRA